MGPDDPLDEYDVGVDSGAIEGRRAMLRLGQLEVEVEGNEDDSLMDVAMIHGMLVERALDIIEEASDEEMDDWWVQ